MKRINKYILIMFLFLLCSTSCKDRCRKYVYINIENEHALAYSAFNVGSYWIYSDSTGLIIDTFTVYDFSSTYQDDGKPRAILSKCYHLERTSCRIRNNSNSKEIGISASLSLRSEKEARIRISYVPDFSSAEGTFILYNNDTDFIPDLDAYGSGSSFIDSYNVNSNTYKDVIKFTNYSNYIYVAKDIGIIEMQTENNTYYLFKYKIYW